MLPRTIILLILLPVVFAPWGQNPGEPTDRENELARWRSIINDIIQMVYKFQNTFPINDNLTVRFRPFNPSKDKYYEKLADFLHTNGQVAPHRRTIVRAGEKIIKKLDEIYDDAGDFYADLKRARGHSPTVSAFKSTLHALMGMKTSLEETLESIKRSGHRNNHRNGNLDEFDRWN